MKPKEGKMNDLTSLYVGDGKSAPFNPNLKFLLDERLRGIWRIYALQGGTRSGKTYATVNYIVWLIEHFTGLTISVVRGTLPALKSTVFRDFEEVMRNEGLWDSRTLNKTSLEYRHNGNLIEFFSADDEQKVRGRKRDLLYVNEANEVTQEKMQQLLFRTTTQVIIDYNPSMVSSYIYDDILTRKDACMIITTYKDNPHLTQATIDEIELLKEKDPELWKVYGCGQRGANRAGLIYDNWSIGVFPDYLPCWYGCDFGFSNDPTAIVRIAFDVKTRTVYLHEVCYRKGLQNSDIARIIRQDYMTRRTVLYDDLEHRIYVQNEQVVIDDKVFLLSEMIHNSGMIRAAINEVVPAHQADAVSRQTDNIAKCLVDSYFDSAEPKSIAELRLYGMVAHPCLKGVGSIVSQIQFVKNFNVVYTKESENLRHEVNSYKWLQKKDDQKNFENEPQAGNDHLMDAARYGIYTHLSKRYETFKSISQIKASR